MSHKLPTPPTTSASTRPSRRKLNASEETSSSSVSRIDTSDEFRMGAPAPLQPLPLCSSSPDPKFLDVWNELRPEIHEILDGKGVQWKAVQLLNRHQQEDEPNIEESTIFVSATKNNDDSWTIAIDALVTLLLDKRATNMNIEFMDSRANKWFYHPRHNTDFAHDWPTIRNKVLAVLGTQEEWASMTLLRRGHDEGNSSLTITIETPRETPLGWKASTYDQVKDIVAPYDYFIDVVFVLSSRYSGEETSLTPLSVDAFRENPVDMGDSLGVKGDTDSGSTIGGYITLQSKSGDQRQFALTNSHCVESDAMTNEEKLRGIPPGSRAANFRLTSPSEAERDRKINACNVDLDSNQELLAPVQWKVDHGAAEPRYLERLATINADVAEIQMELHRIKHADLDFGQLYASSGKRYFRKTARVIDWALIAPIPRRQGANKLPAREEVKNTRPTRYLPSGPFLDTVERSVKVGDLVVKKGRSGVSWGRFTGFKIDIRLPEGLCTAMVVLNTSSSFMCAGDSGCMAMNNFGELIGLGFGGCVNSNTGYVMPIQDVFEDIEAVTGMRVVEPRLQD